MANDHCYTPLTSPSQRATHASRVNSQNTPVVTNNRKSANKSTNLNEGSVNKVKAKVIQGFTKSQLQQKSVIELSDDDDANSDDDGEESGSDLSYFSPSESENDRDSDLDFSVNDRPSRVRKINRSRSIRSKQNKSNSKIVTKKRHSASAEGGSFQGDESPTISNTSGSKKKLQKIPRRINRNSISVTTPPATVPQPKIKLTPITLNVGLQPKAASTPITTTSTVLSTVKPVIMTTPKNTQIGSHKLILTKIVAKPNVVHNTLLKTELHKSMLAPIQSITSGPPMPALAPISDKPIISTAIISNKKDKKPPAHVEALFSDMTSLFSTPDIIKKVGISSSGSPSCISVVTIPPTTLKPILIGPQKTSTITTIPGTAPTKCYFMPLTASSSKNRLPAQISIQTHSSSSSISSTPLSLTTNLGSEQDKQLDLIDSIVQQELKQTVAPGSKTAMNVETSNIVKMLEHNTGGIISNVINLNTPSVSTTSSTTNNSVPFTVAITNDTPLLDDDSDLLDSLTNPDDGLTEDLLQHVAKLVEDKNLQEVIDKQVLGVNKAVAKSSPVIIAPIKVAAPLFQQQKQVKPNRQQPRGNIITSLTPATVVSATPPASVTTPTSILLTTAAIPATPPSSVIRPVALASAGKEPIKIVRSDGRVITLPPIEAPTTRGAKRRAQNQPAGTSPVVPAATLKSDVKSIPKELSSTPSTSNNTTKERRVSIALKKNTEQQATKTKLQPQQLPSALVASQNSDLPKPENAGYEDDDDDDSDGSYNSEDDPHRYKFCFFFFF